ncbi:MAG: hypothetical protein RI539_07395 [Spiribacter sp.]|nr:hypothetical protein [Spiribacter sp.]MDR9490149.1 hypothetical protein [Spiribacter sp.]
MGLFKFGEKNADGQQKRIEHTGRYLRASRTGGISLRAQTRVAGVNLTGNTSHGARISTQLAKNTQVAFQNGRFVLRGRYGSDAAKFNLSKSGVTVSTKTDVGAFNWIKPARSSFKFAGVNIRGRNAAYLQAAYHAVKLVAESARVAAMILLRLSRWIAAATGHVYLRYQLAQEARSRVNLSLSEAQVAGQSVLDSHAVTFKDWKTSELMAGMIFTLAVLGRGDNVFPLAHRDIIANDKTTRERSFQEITAAGELIKAWLGVTSQSRDPAAIIGVMLELTHAWANRVDQNEYAKALFFLDDVCLALGPRTILQNEIIDRLPELLDLEIEVLAEGG